MTAVDKDIMFKLLKQIKPNQVFCAGDLADPYGTNKVCLDVLFKSLKK